MKTYLPKAQSLRDVVRIQLDAIIAAHIAIGKGNYPEGVDVGETTLAETAIIDGHLVATTVGDCKIFIIRNDGRKRVCFEPTKASRMNSKDATDSGGRIGKNSPDLGNLACYTCPLKQGDQIIICSDGIHDNFDPETLKEGIGRVENKIEEMQRRQQIMLQKLLEVVDATCTTPDAIVKALNKYVSRTTQKYKVAQLEGHRMKSSTIPGKPDHCGIVVLQYEI